MSKPFRSQFRRPEPFSCRQIFLSNHSRPMTQRHLNRAAASMSATSPNRGKLRVFAMNGCLQQIAANRLSIPQDVIAILLQGFVRLPAGYSIGHGAVLVTVPISFASGTLQIPSMLGVAGSCSRTRDASCG